MFKFFSRIKRICDYLPLLWQDEDHDYAYMLKIMEFKMRRMADHIREHDIMVGSDKVAKTLMITAEHMRRATYDQPMPEDLSKALNEWWTSRLWVDVGNDTVQMKDPNTPESDKLRKKLRRLENKHQAQIQYHFAEFIKYLNKYLRTWWD